MRPRTLLLLAIAALAGATVAVLPALAAAPSDAKLEVNENCVENNWPCWALPGSGTKPPPASTVTIAPGGEVTFLDSAGTKANLAWSGAAAACSPSVPVSPSEPRTSWEGTCKFEQAGTYRFESSTLFNGGPGEDYTKYEIVVEAPATGTTTTMTTSTTPAAPTTTPTSNPTTPGEAGPSSGSPVQGGSRALRLPGSQHGSRLRGSIEVSQAGAGGRLEVGLFAASASLARTRNRELVRVGRLVRASLQAGSVAFSVPLSGRGRSTLHRRGRLVLTVKITLTPLHGAAVKLMRGVVVHA